MTPDLKNDSSLGLTPLVAGIVEDAQTLISQQLSLFQSEIKEDLDRSKAAAIPLAVGMAVCLLSGFFIFMMVAQLLMYEWPQLPQWAAYGIVGGFLAIVGGALLATGFTLFEKVNLVSSKAVQALKENLQWKTRK